MELPVGDFINDALATDVPTLARELLQSNVKDEEKHDLALGYIADAYGVDPKAEKEAKILRDAWVSHPDHTILKAKVAETAIFFVLLPFFRWNGSASMRTVSADISRDWLVGLYFKKLGELLELLQNGQSAAKPTYKLEGSTTNSRVVTQ